MSFFIPWNGFIFCSLYLVLNQTSFVVNNFFREKDVEAFEKLSDSQQALQAEPDPSSLTSNYRNKGIAVGLPPGISMQDMTFSVSMLSFPVSMVVAYYSMNNCYFILFQWKVVGYSPCSASCLGGKCLYMAEMGNDVVRDLGHEENVCLLNCTMIYSKALLVKKTL